MLITTWNKTMNNNPNLDPQPHKAYSKKTASKASRLRVSTQLASSKMIPNSSKSRLRKF